MNRSILRQLWPSLLALPLALLLLFFYLMGLSAAPGSPSFLDPTFGHGGSVLIPITGTNQIARDVAIQSDGKLIIAGYDKWRTDDYDVILARVNADGSLDTAFGTNGVVTSPLSSGHDTAYAVAVQPDGKIVAAGITNIGGDTVAALVRYTSDGKLDTTFGTNGVASLTHFRPRGSWFLSVVVLNDGRIVAGGGVDSNPDAFLLARYRADGSLDTTLGGAGVVTTTVAGGDVMSWDMAIQPDGKMVLVGFFRRPTRETDLVMIRYNVDGSVDTGFGNNGVVVQDIGLYEYAYGVNVQSSGRIVLGGVSTSQGIVARYLPNGSMDSSFGPVAGLNYVTTTVPGYKSIAFIETTLLADDTIVAATRFSGDRPAVGLTVFDKNGYPYPGVGGNGAITTTLGTHVVSSYALLAQPDGKVVLAGHVDVDDSRAYEYDLALWRYALRMHRLYLPSVSQKGH